MHMTLPFNLNLKRAFSKWTQLSHKSKPYTINILKVFLLLIFEELSAKYRKSISLLLFGDFVQNFLHCEGCWLITYIMNIYFSLTSFKLQYASTLRFKCLMACTSTPASLLKVFISLRSFNLPSPHPGSHFILFSTICIFSLFIKIFR